MNKANKETTKEIEGQMSIANFTHTADGQFTLNSMKDYQNV
jgi:hypothetical protein